ncbi:MAG: M12 family metallo-peptidase [Motiliproteus sp.]
MEGVKKRHFKYKNRGEVWHGKVSKKPDSRITLARVGDSVHGTIQIGNDLYKIRPDKGKSHVIEKMDGKLPFPELDPRPGIPLADTGVDQSSSSSLPVPDTSNGAVIDVMVVYTPAANAATSNMESLILLAIEETNQAYLSSGIDAQLNLVHTAVVNYTEAASMQADLSNLTYNNDGFMDAIHAYRNTYGADMVSLIVKRSDYCGMAWLMNSPTVNFSSSAFSVVNYSCATGYFSFGHELGHNMGITHARQDTSGGGAFPYSFGFKDEATRTFRTIMAYNCTSNCTRRPFFSNPNTDYNGLATGADHNIDPFNSADNSRALNGTVSNVMSWRAAIQNNPPVSPTGLAAAVLSSDEIALSWNDLSDDETGFSLERSENGTNWLVTATTAANGNGYTDSGLTPNRSYSYRVNAFNSAGGSNYSAAVTATTKPLPSSFEQQITSEQSTTGSASGSYSALRMADSFTEKLTEVSLAGSKTLQHVWQFELQPGNAHTLKFVGSVASTSSDNFQILHSTDGINYTHSFVVNAGDAGEFQSVLTPGYSGSLYTMARDTNSSSEDTSNDTLTVDQLLVLTENILGDPPYPPLDLTATGVTSDSAQLNWINDSRINRSGTYVFRDGSLIETLNLSATSYSDSGLDSATSYQYSLKSFNSAGSSVDSNSATAATEQYIAVTLSLRAYSARGSHRTVLRWTPAAEMDIYRDGSLIATVNGRSFGDRPGTKGAATFSYQVCIKGTSQCSATKMAVFK